jgi:hypothetical protein
MANSGNSILMFEIGDLNSRGLSKRPQHSQQFQQYTSQVRCLRKVILEFFQGGDIYVKEGDWYVYNSGCQVILTDSFEFIGQSTI